MQSTNKLLASGLMAISLSVATPIGKGQSFFSDPTNYPVGMAPRAIAIGDFNGDGKQDLAIADYGDSVTSAGAGVSILLGNGDGTFRAAQELNAGVAAQTLAAPVPRGWQPELRFCSRRYPPETRFLPAGAERALAPIQTLAASPLIPTR
jgi:hypothetical protein